MECRREEMVVYFKALSQYVSKDFIYGSFNIAGSVAGNDQVLPR